MEPGEVKDLSGTGEETTMPRIKGMRYYLLEGYAIRATSLEEALAQLQQVKQEEENYQGNTGYEYKHWVIGGLK